MQRLPAASRESPSKRRLKSKRLVLAAGFFLKGDIPRQKLVDLLHWMVCNAADDAAEIGFRVNAVHFGRFDEGVHCGGAFPATIVSREEPVFATNRHGPDGALGGIVADVEAPVGRVTGEGFPSESE